MKKKSHILEDFKPLFYPRSVAVVGASNTPRKVGNYCMRSLADGGFEGKIYPVNSNASEILGLKSYPSLGAIPESVDMALIVVPASSAPTLTMECAHLSIRGMILISAGFKEIESGGAKLQEEVAAIANEAKIKIIGPNTHGLVNPYANLNASFQTSFKGMKKGHIAVISQSGGICAFIIHSMMNQNIGITVGLSVGNRCNVDFADLLEYFAEDSQTKVIVMYLEGIDNPRSLIEVAKTVTKPIIAYKCGNEMLNKTAVSHTGSLAGKYELYNAAFAQAGIISVNSITDLVDIAKALVFQPATKGNRVAILSRQVGPAIAAASICQKFGLSLAKFSSDTKRRLRKLVGLLNSVENPVDIAWAAADHETIHEILKIASADENVDSLLVSSVSHPSGEPLIRSIADLAHKKLLKPTVVCYDSPLGIAGKEVAEIERSDIPVYPLPERAARALSGLVESSKISQKKGKGA